MINLGVQIKEETLKYGIHFRITYVLRCNKVKIGYVVLITYNKV